MNNHHHPPITRRPRRKWRRAAAADRQTAAQALAASLGVRARRGWLLLLALLVLASLAFHAALLTALGFSAATNAPLAGAKDAYLQKVIQKERARVVAASVARKITMPPPPPDPENVVRDALGNSLISDVTKLTGNLLDVNLQGELASYVKSSLKDELAAAARNIADGKLSEEEIQELHRKFQEKAHEKTLQWRQEYLIKTQEERAAMSTTEWYEDKVAKTLFRNVSFELFTPPNYTAHPPSPELWHHVFCGQYDGWTRDPNWSDLRSGQYLRSRLAALDVLAQGAVRKYYDSKERKEKFELHPSSPGPNAEQAQFVLETLNKLHKGWINDNGTYPSPSWHNILHGGIDTIDAPERSYQTCQSSGILSEFYPHKDPMPAVAEQADKAWETALAAAEQYARKAEAGVPEQELRAAQKACFEAIEAIRAAAAPLLVPASEDMWPRSPHRTINAVLRVQVLRGPDCERVYKLWGDEMVADLEPVVRDFAKGQFKKGIIVHKDGTASAMREFTNQIVPLMRRDLERMLPLPRWKRIVFEASSPYHRYQNKLGQDTSVPSDDDVKADEAVLAKTLAAHPELREYADKRREILVRQFEDGARAVKEEILTRVLTGNLLLRNLDVIVEGVDYADKVQEKLTAREMAMKGRGQDLAKLTADGLPDTSAPLVALMLGASKGHGANLQPVATLMQADMVNPTAAFDVGVLAGPWQLPPLPAPWSVRFEQPTVKPPFGNNTPRFECIPFLTRFPRLDGDLSDWGRLRPLVLRQRNGQGGPMLVYAAWNYQGFFFGVKVIEEPERFYWPSQWQRAFNHNTGDVQFTRATGWEWALKGDHVRLLFDTLDARNTNRGEPHTQEFVIFPQGTESDPGVPGIERVIASQRDAKVKEYRSVKATCQVFPQQPPPQNGPDGSGPYRVTRMAKDGYTLEVFLPRTLFKQPVFCPGWCLGFECVIGTGVQQSHQPVGQFWAGGRNEAADHPDQWGDVLLLGTDPQIVIQEANASGSPVTALVPGHSYMLTVVDPDRNVSSSQKDTVLVSAEVDGGRGDVEVFLLTEDGENSGRFRGCINTQPGLGRQVQGALEVLPMQEVRLGYVDWANAKGQRNVIYETKLPVLSPAARSTSRLQGGT
jgi:hypothetical protein